MPKKQHPARHVRRRTADPFPVAAVVLSLSGCAAEVYLLLIRRYCFNGSYRQMTVWLYALPLLGWTGIAAAACGAGWWASAARQKRENRRRETGACLLAEGIVLASLSFLCRYVSAALTPLLAIVPAVTLLGILWLLYDRESALSLTVLGAAICAAWLCRRRFGVSLREARIIVFAALFLLAAALLLYAGPLRRVLLPGARGTQFLAALLLSLTGMFACLPGPLWAYYAMWTLALTAFGFTVYDTVKQL